MPKVALLLSALVLGFSISSLGSTDSIVITQPDPVYKAIYLDSNSVLTGDQQGVLRLWDVEGQRLLWQSPKLGGPIFSLDYSSHSRVIAIGLGSSTRSLILAERTADDELEILQLHDVQGPVIVSLSETSNRVGIGSSEGAARVIEATAAAGTLEGSIFEKSPQYLGESSAISPQGDLFALSTNAVHDGNSHNPKWSPADLKLFHVSSGEELTSLTVKGVSLFDLVFAKDSKRIAARSFRGEWGGPATAAPNTLHVWDIATGTALFEQSFSEFVNAYEFSGAGDEILVGVASGGLALYEVGTGRKLWSRATHDESILDIEVSKDLTSVLTAGADGKVVIQSLR